MFLYHLELWMSHRFMIWFISSGNQRKQVRNQIRPSVIATVWMQNWIGWRVFCPSVQMSSPNWTNSQCWGSASASCGLRASFKVRRNVSWQISLLKLNYIGSQKLFEHFKINLMLVNWLKLIFVFHSRISIKFDLSFCMFCGFDLG